MHYCKGMGMFALQRLAVLLKSSRSQMCSLSSPMAALPWCQWQSGAVCGRLWHSLSELLTSLARPFLALLTEIKPGSAPGTAFFSAFEGWLDFAPVGWVPEAGLHHHCRSGWAPVITCLCFFSCYWHIFVSNINISVVLRRTAHYVLVSLMLLFCSGWQCWLCKRYLML